VAKPSSKGQLEGDVLSPAELRQRRDLERPQGPRAGRHRASEHGRRGALCEREIGAEDAGRPVILAGAAAALSPQGDIVLSHPTPRAVLDALSRAFARETAQTLVAEPSDARAAA
jgi:hypothetical protein